MKRRHIIEDSLSVFALLAMAVLPLLEIALRKFFSTGIPGSAVWVQHLTLWVAFLGAALAARKGELLSLSAGISLLGQKTRDAAQIFASGMGVAVCGTLAYGSLQLVLVEREGGSLLALGLPVWVAQGIMPLGFLVIGLRMLGKAPFGWKGRAITGSFLIFPILMWAFEGLPGHGLWIPLLVVFMAATVLGAPIFVILAGVAAVLLWDFFEPISAIAVETYGLTLKSILPTIPLFAFAGYILAEGGTPARLVGLFRALFGWMPGGLALAAIVVCAFFTSFTGGSGVTVLAMGGLLYPMLRGDNHSHSFTSGLLTSSGSLGLLFPPSLAVLLYGIVAEIDIPTLFVSGLVPGILEIALVAGFALLYSQRSGTARVPFNFQKAARALWDSKWEVAIPILVLGSMLSGLATLVEASAITVLYAFVLEFFIRRNLRLRGDLTRVVGSAATLIGSVLLILGVALGLTNFFVMQEIPSQATAWVQSFVDSPLFFLLLLNLFLLVVGCLMDMFSAIVVVVPLIAPLGLFFGIDPFHLGIIFLTNLELGFLTPPVGMNLFLASNRFQRPLFEVYRSVLPFLAIRIVAVGLVTYVPALTTTLPRLWGR